MKCRSAQVAIATCVIVGLRTISFAAEPIEIVAMFNLSGPESVLDLPCYRGAEVAVEQVNGRGGIRGRSLELIPVDTRSDLQGSAEMAKNVIDKHPDAVAGIGFAYSSYVLTTGPAFQSAGIPFVTPGATDPTLATKIGDQIFLACYGDDAQAIAMARYAYDQLELRRISLWADQDMDYTVTVAHYFELAFTRLGGTVTRIDFRSDQTEFKSMIEGFQASRQPADAIYSASLPRTGKLQIEQCRQSGIDVPLLSGDGWDDPEIAALSKQQELGGIYYTTHRFLGVRTPEMKSFVAAYRHRFGKAPETAFAPLGYDALHLIANAMQRADSTERSELGRSLAGTTDFDGVVGTISFTNGSHTPTKPVEIVRLESGRKSAAGTVMASPLPR